MYGSNDQRESGGTAVPSSGYPFLDVRLPGKGNSNSHGARPVHLSITMIKWIRTRRLSTKNCLSPCPKDQEMAKSTLPRVTHHRPGHVWRDKWTALSGPTSAPSVNARVSQLEGSRTVSYERGTPVPSHASRIIARPLPPSALFLMSEVPLYPPKRHTSSPQASRPGSPNSKNQGPTREMAVPSFGRVTALPCDLKNP